MTRGMRRLPAPRALPELRGAILRWYRRHRRDLPWRRTRDPYAIWVSEIMLQQTRVETVIPYYERFVRRFPTVERLARAREAEVLAAWSGLGYYARARSLKEAAALVAREHGGRLPREIDALRRLPGIGPYTAAAIASVAHGVPAAAVDGNVVRVIARIFGLRGRTGRRDDPALKREVEAIAERLAAGPEPGDWTQALMELGATVCAPRAPRCELCPAARRCVARRSGDAAAFPYPARPGAGVKERRLVMLAARSGDRVLLVREGGGSGWGLPSAEANASPRGGRSVAARLVGTWMPGAHLMGSSHVFRHHTYAEDVTYEVWEASLAPGEPPRGAAAKPKSNAARWADRKLLDKLPLRSPTLKAIKKLRVS